ncbi:MAG TPA: hypothetical protein VMK84_22120, partial [Streptosporangiaceae bacterium]|nr:hypothetical protein [Streptosporangiaceae bacterium]
MHSAQGTTVHTGIALVTGGEDRQWLYPAMTRGTDANIAFVFTTPARAADPAPGTCPAAGLDRYDRIRRERAGYPPPPVPREQPDQADQREPAAVLAEVLGRDGAALSATAIRQHNLANADHLGILHAIWTAETQAARHDRYRDLVMAELPPGHQQPLSHQARWLFRTLHAAELAGLDPAEVLRTAITSRDLAGARDIAAVLDAQTAWAPRHAGKQLRLSRLGAFDAALGALRADAEAAAARKDSDHDRAARHETLAASYRALRDAYQQREHTLTQAAADRKEWEQATPQSRRLAIAADAELRRRHPHQKIEPLRSAEPAPARDTEHEQRHRAPD